MLVERLDGVKRASVDARYNLGDLGEGKMTVTGVDAFGAVTQVEIASWHQPGTIGQDAGEQLLSCARVSRGLEHHHRPRLEVLGQGAAGVLDE